jgi:hypothetical protein
MHELMGTVRETGARDRMRTLAEGTWTCSRRIGLVMDSVQERQDVLVMLVMTRMRWSHPS